MDQDKCRFYADMINEYRVFPRIFVLGYGVFYMYAWLVVFDWFTTFDWNLLPKDQVVGAVSAGAVAGFPAIILAAMGKMLKEMIESYWRDPDKDGAK